MNTVSFGSTYKINANNNNQNQFKVFDFCEKNGLEYAIKTDIKEVNNGFRSKTIAKTSTSIVAPDNKDSLVEAYLANRGIKFSKLDTKELYSKSGIKSRIEDAPKGMRLVTVDTKKLEKLISNQDNNIKYCEENYNDYYKGSVDLMIKSGDKLPATTLYITPTGESTEDTVSYIKKFGADRLNEDQLSFMFVKRTDDPDHCLYYALKNLGMDKVPVYVDKDTHSIGSALGIFK